jgi:hypothetical protein
MVTQAVNQAARADDDGNNQEHPGHDRVGGRIKALLSHALARESRVIEAGISLRAGAI